MAPASDPSTKPEFVVVLGDRIRALRQESGLSQEQLAATIGMHRTYIGHVERGEVSPTLETVLRIAKGLDAAGVELLKDLPVDDL